eukprot:gene25172-biopygen2975
MGPEVGPASQRLSRDTRPCLLGVRLAETGSTHVDSKGIPAFALRSEPPHARAPGAQIIRMASGSSLAFQRLSRDTPHFLASGWRVGISTLRTERERDREQVGQ